MMKLYGTDYNKELGGLDKRIKILYINGVDVKSNSAENIKGLS